MFDFSDTRMAQSQLQVLRAFNGDLRTHKNSHSAKAVHSWNFQVTRMKALEYKAFFQLHAADLWKVEEQSSSDSWIGYVKPNPLTLSMDKISQISDSREKVNLLVEFEIIE
jgi:hypothetical protein